MKKFLGFCSLVVLTACTDATEKQEVSKGNDIAQALKCEISIGSLEACAVGDIYSELVIEKLADDEIQLNRLLVNYKGKQHQLNISEDTSMLGDDIGFQKIEDVNFDGHLDIAVTTSFGLANLYMDYWVFDSEKNSYVYIGNHTQFSLDKKNKTLRHTTKINAENYEERSYKWEGNKLIQQ